MRSKLKRLLKWELFLFVFLLGELLFFSLLTPGFLNIQNLLFSMNDFAYIGLAAFSYYFCYSYWWNRCFRRFNNGVGLNYDWRSLDGWSQCLDCSHHRLINLCSMRFNQRFNYSLYRCTASRCYIRNHVFVRRNRPCNFRWRPVLQDMKVLVDFQIRSCKLRTE